MRILVRLAPMTSKMGKTRRLPGLFAGRLPTGGGLGGGGLGGGGLAGGWHPSIGTMTVDTPSLTDPVQSAGIIAELKKKNPPLDEVVTPAPSHRMRAPDLAAWLRERRTTPPSWVALVTVSAEAGALSPSSDASTPTHPQTLRLYPLFVPCIGSSCS